MNARYMLGWPCLMWLILAAASSWGQSSERSIKVLLPPVETSESVIAPTSVDPERRVALVIGIDNYPRPNDLGNPIRDAGAMERALKELKFEKVIVLKDATRDEINRGLAEFASALSRKDAAGKQPGVGVFYFAGHGVQINGENFLIPKDVDITSELAIKYNATSVRQVMEHFVKAKTPIKILILDACRNNPFVYSRGLAVPSQKAEGALIAFSTSPGDVALDGKPGENGLYTAQLVAALREAGRTVEDVFKRTRANVASATNGQQVPWESTSLTATLVLRPGPAAKEVAASIPLVQAPDGARRRCTDSTSGVECFQDCDVCPEMIVLHGDSFRMGSPVDEAGRNANEGPQTTITIKRFAVARYELTFEEWNACFLERSRKEDSGRSRCSHWPSDEGWGRDTHPVINVSWEDAQAYVRWLSERTKKNYRLLTEAEWEYAARAGAQTSRPWGTTLETRHARCRDCGADGSTGTRTADTYPASTWGLRNMLGNVWEWVEDCQNPDLKDMPKEGAARETGDCSQRVIRGGSWVTSAKGVRSATRAFQPADHRDMNIGFRVAVSME